MRRFTVTLFIFSLFFILVIPSAYPFGNGTDNQITVCKAHTSRWNDFIKGLKLSLREKGIELLEAENCTREELSFNNETASLESLLPSIPEETEHIVPLVTGNNVAVIYRKRENLLAKVLILELEKQGKKVVLDAGFQDSKSVSYKSLINNLLQLKKKKINIDTLVFIGSYKEATLFVPFFRIFSPKPTVVGTWRISSVYMFSYRKFMKKLVFYDWYTPFEPLMSERKFCLTYQKRYKEPPSRYAFLGYRLGLNIASQKKLAVKREYKLIKLKNLPRLAPFCRF